MTRRSRLHLVDAGHPRKPVYERVPLFGAVIVDRRDAWQARRDAMESEQVRAASIARSSAFRAVGAGS